MSDPYSLLGVAREASDDEVKAAFRKKAMLHHPDRNPGDLDAERRFKEINAAFTQIKEERERPQQQHHNPFGFDQHSMFEEILRQFHQSQAPRNNTYHTQCTITLEQALRGCDLQVKIENSRELIVKIPPGIDNGGRIRCPGMGDQRHANLPPGDLFVTVFVQPSQTFGRQGQTLFSDVHIDTIDSLLGETIRVPTIDGDTVEISNGAKPIQAGWKVRVAGRGMPDVHTGQRGDHVVTVHLRSPVTLNERQIELLREVQSLSKGLQS